jgi:hypothetical protein
MGTLKNFLRYHFGKPNNERTYLEMRHDYVHSKRRSVDMACKVNGFLNPKFKIKSSHGIAGDLCNAEADRICDQIKSNGYYIFPNLLNKAIVDELKTFASTAPVHYLIAEGDNISYSKESVKYIEANEISNRYQILDISHFRHSKAALDIAMDANLLHVANNYLGAKPILDLIIFWWSRSFQNVNIEETTKELLKNRSAQLFHFDMDRLKFLKFFIYLTDVNTRTGPHVYVRNTHQKIPAYIKKDGRYADDFINKEDGANVVEINGKAGSVIAVDTRGLHKGKELEDGERLIFQLEFANSLFGNPQLPGISEKFKYTGPSEYFESYRQFCAK